MPNALLISVGNTRTRIAMATGDKLEPSRLVANADEAELREAVRVPCSALAADGASAVLIASVNDPVADPLAASLEDLAGTGRGRRLIRLGRGLAVPIQTNLVGPMTVGTDRLLNALAAHGKSGEACVVIDAGTALTVDFIDKWGVFQGGCIAPGLGLMLRSLNEHTAQLPKVDPPKQAPRIGPDAPPLGKTTIDAMTKGCLASLQGAVRLLIDRYADLNAAYPRVIATGGDAALLAESDEWTDVIHIVPDLTLMGMLAAWTITRGGAEERDG